MLKLMQTADENQPAYCGNRSPRVLALAGAPPLLLQVCTFVGMRSKREEGSCVVFRYLKSVEGVTNTGQRPGDPKSSRNSIYLEKGAKSIRSIV